MRIFIHAQDSLNPQGAACRVHRAGPSLTRRRAAVAVEAAVVYPVMLLLLVGLIVVGLGVFRYQLVACQAREAARWASVRGSEWAKETSQKSPTRQQILEKAVLPLAKGMDPEHLSIKVEWINPVTGEAVDWDKASKTPTSKNDDYVKVSNHVRVTVSYQWIPGIFSISPFYLKSVSEIPMSF